MDREIVKTLKAISKEEEVDLALCITGMSEVEKEALQKTLNVLDQILQGTEKNKIKKSRKFQISMEDFYKAFINKLEENLEKYERDDKIDKWVIDIDFQKDYEKCEDQDFIESHIQIVKSETDLIKLSLLVKSERGRLYFHLRKQKSGSWEKFCRENLQVCSKTAKRYIDFYQLCLTYPRLVITGLSFESIMSNSLKLVNTLKIDANLCGRLMMPLKETLVFGKLFKSDELFTERKPKVLRLNSSEFKWGVNWDIRDELEESMQNKKKRKEAVIDATSNSFEIHTKAASERDMVSQGKANSSTRNDSDEITDDLNSMNISDKHN